MRAKLTGSAAERLLRIFQVDAFTSTRFTGNPATVVLDADGQSDATLQAVAREFSHAEVQLVLKREEAPRFGLDAAGADPPRLGWLGWIFTRPLDHDPDRSEEHTSELQSLRHLVCRLLLEKKTKKKTNRKPTANTYL